jgi:hypothetical protein
MSGQRYSLELETMEHGMVLIRKIGDKRIDSWYFSPLRYDIGIIQIIKCNLGLESKSIEELSLELFKNNVDDFFKLKQEETYLMNKRLDEAEVLVKESVDKFKILKGDV